ncbi:2Fe-2S iron-sulfur cluster-binding protein [Thermodesulfobacteriota bacterium]
MLSITVDDRDLDVAENTTILAACLANDIYIPNLCYLEGMAHPPASCRLCFVEVAGMDRPVTACTIQVAAGMRVQTNTETVRCLQRSALRLLLSVHHIDCRHCQANKQCELQRIARFLNVGLKAKPLETFLKQLDVDTSHPFIDYYPNRCVLCGKCITACRNRNGLPFIAFARRGFHTIISSYGQETTPESCADCDACVSICPVAAIVRKTG